MKIWAVTVINLVFLSLVRTSQSHPPIIISKSEPDNVPLFNRINSTFPEVTQPITTTPEQPKLCGATIINTKNGTDSINGDELVFAHVLYRHGQRDIPNNIELTNEGKCYLFKLGQYFHRRYGKILGNEYRQEKVYIVSTDHDRAIMSAQANLAGLYEPTDTEKWHQDILWQPIPVHTLPKVLDNILRPRYDDRCPKYDEMYDWYIKKSPEAKAMYNKYGHLFKEWSDQSGKRISHIEHVFSIYKKFLSQKQQNEPIPPWAEEACRPGGPMEEIARVVYLLRAKPDLVRIRSGFLLKEMLERFKTKQKGKFEPDRVLFMYSAHSSTISTLLNGMGFNMSIPSHGFSFQFEMYKTPQDKYYLQLFFRQPDQEYPKPEHVEGCGEKCTIEELYKVYDHLIPDQSFEKACGVKKNQPDQPETPNEPDEHGKPNSATINANGHISSIVLCSLWFIRKLFSKFHYEIY